MSVPGTYIEQQAGLPVPSMRGAAHGSAKASDADRFNLGRLWSMIRRRLWLALAIFTAVMAAAVAITAMQPRMYQADAMVLLRDTGQQLEQRVTDEVDEPTMTGDADVNTEIQVAGSIDTAERVARALNITQDAALLGRIAPGAVIADGAALTPTDRERLNTQIAMVLRSGLGLSRLGTSYSLAFSYRHSDPQIAALLANSFAEQYVAGQIERKRLTTDQATTFLAGKVAELREQATVDFGAVQAYRISNGLLSNSATALTEQDISVYNQQAATARAEAAADAARLSTARRQLRDGSNGGDVGEALTSSVVSSLRTQRAQVAARVADLSTRYGSRHPDLLRAQQELHALDGQIQEEINRVVSNLEARAEVSSQRLASIDATLSSTRGVLAGNNRALVALDDLQRRAEASQGLYESYLARYRQVLAGSGTEQPDARILTRATDQIGPYSPNVLLNLILAGMIGLIAALVAAIALELQFKGLTTAEDVERRTGLPFLGLVPENKSVPHHAATPLETVAQSPNSVIAESVRGIVSATHIPGTGSGQVLAVTSALPDEGKTVLTALLGTTASAGGSRVVIVDCDIMRRGLSRLTGFAQGPGLREIASGAATLDQALQPMNDGGPVILPITGKPNEGERLAEHGMIHAVVAQLKERFDLILLDCPPLLAIAEAREIAGLADGVVINALWRKTPDDAIRAAARLLPATLTNYVGVVLTRVDLRKQSRYAGEGPSGYTDAYVTYAAAQ